MSRRLARRSAAGGDEEEPAEVASVPTRRERESLATFAAFVSTISDFLEVAIHQIVYERHIYPKDLFHDRSKFSIATKTSRHPQVNKWINDAVKAVSEELLKNSVKRVAVVILSPNDQSLERFVFDMSSFPSIPPNKHHTSLLQPGGDVLLSGEALANLEAQFRACLTKLKICSEPLGKLPDDCTFGLAIELNNEQATPNNYTDTWMPCEKQLLSKYPDSVVASARECVKTTPLRTLETGAINMSVWIEETKAKTKLVAK